jgi:drug/metabolite transporter (DMT)-like permease
LGWSPAGVKTARSLGVKQALTLLCLGPLASGFCFFWWNKGAVKTDAGTLAVFVSLLVFGERADIPRLLLGGGLMLAAVGLAQRGKKL